MFWRKGYEGTSIDDLTEAMGINRPSLYCAFGNKEQLFRKALDRYLRRGRRLYARGDRRADGAGRRRAAAAQDGRRPDRPVQPAGMPGGPGRLSCGEAADPIRQELNARRAAAEAALRERFERAKSEGDLPPDDDPADLARYLATVIQGMAVQAAGGASRDDLRRVAETALRAWPGASPKSRR